MGVSVNTLPPGIPPGSTRASKSKLSINYCVNNVSARKRTLLSRVVNKSSFPTLAIVTFAPALLITSTIVTTSISSVPSATGTNTYFCMMPVENDLNYL